MISNYGKLFFPGVDECKLLSKLDNSHAVKTQDTKFEKNEFFFEPYLDQLIENIKPQLKDNFAKNDNCTKQDSCKK